MAALHDHHSITSLAGDGEPPPPSTADRHRGGWTTFPFVIASICGLTLAAGGLVNNLIVFLIKEFNIKSVDAAQINNFFNGCVNLFPLIGAVVADSLLGCFSVIAISSLISLLGFILLLLTVTVDNLSPPSCKLNICIPPSRSQYAALYSALALVSIGVGGTRFTLATMGANQFTKLNHQSTYFNWYFFSLYASSFISATAIVYVEDNVSWSWGFGICIAANVIGLAFFLLGSPYYCHDKPQSSPFIALLRVVVATYRKRKAVISSEAADYYYGDDDDDDDNGVAEAPTKRFRLLNRAAFKAEGDIILPNGSIATPWTLCTVRQVEDLKNLMRIIPLWSSSIFLSTPIGVLLSLTVLQALTTDRHVARLHFQLSAGSMIVFALLSTAAGVILTDRCLFPMWRRLRGTNPTPLHQIGIGHVLNIASMAAAALVESKRRGAATSSPRHVMSVTWLVPQMVVVGVGESFHFPGQVALYYQEFPFCLKSLSSAMVAVVIGLAYYLSTAVVDFIRRITDWLPNNIDDGRVDYVYWVMVVIAVINFGYYLVISWLYRCKNEDRVEKGGKSVGV